jgi:hypothetical protein
MNRAMRALVTTPSHFGHGGEVSATRRLVSSLHFSHLWQQVYGLFLFWGIVVFFYNSLTIGFLKKCCGLIIILGRFYVK